MTSCTSSSSNFRSVVKNPCFISSHNGVQKLISFLCAAREKLQRGSCVEKSYDGTHLAFGGTLDRRCHFKHVSLEQSRFYHSNEHGSQVKDQGRRQYCHNKHKNVPIGPHMMYFYFRDRPIKCCETRRCVEANQACPV
jgi:hypothetical protein